MVGNWTQGLAAVQSVALVLDSQRGEKENSRMLCGTLSIIEALRSGSSSISFTLSRPLPRCISSLYSGCNGTSLNHLEEKNAVHNIVL